jgi:SnoaL-like protein
VERSFGVAAIVQDEEEGVMTLSVEDRVDILDLYAWSNMALDAHDPSGYAAAFTSDGVLDSTSRVGGTLLTGREEIQAKFEDRRRRFKQHLDNDGVLDGQHWNSNVVVTGDRDVARGSCYVLVFGRDPTTGVPVISVQGQYRDELRKVNGRWLFARRTLSFVFDMRDPKFFGQSL